MTIAAHQSHIEFWRYIGVWNSYKDASWQQVSKKSQEGFGIYIYISAQRLPQESVAIVQLGNGLALTDSALGLAIGTGSATDGRACSEESAGKSSGPL